MPVETATYVADLNANNPVASDGLAQADDHMRLTKSVLKATFPSLTGPVTATQTQLNVLATLTYPIVAADIAANAVTTVKILDANVTTAKIADANVTTAKIADANVTTVKILDANVTTAKIANLNVTTGKLADGAVTAAKIASLTNARLLGNNSGGAAAPSEIALGTGLAFSGATTMAVTAVPDSALSTPGAWKLIQTQTPSAVGQVDFTTGLDDTYDVFELRMSSVHPATDDAYPMILIGTGVGPTYQTSGYHYQGAHIIAGVVSADGSSVATEFRIVGSNVGGGLSSNSGKPFNGALSFSDPEVAAIMPMTFVGDYVNSAGNLMHVTKGGAYMTAAAVTGVRFKFSAGNIGSGRFSLYGLKKS